MRPRHSVRRSFGAGFTLPELVVVILVAGIVAAVAAPRLSKAPLVTAGYHDRLQAALQFARKAAVAQRRNVCVAVAAGNVTLTRATAAGAASACTAGVLDPATGQAFDLTAPGGVALGSTSNAFSFDALGRASQAVSITVSGDGSHVITIEATTGYIH